MRSGKPIGRTLRKPSETSFRAGLLALGGMSVGMAVVEVARYPAYFAQRGARIFLFEAICALLVYAVAVVPVSRARGPYWDAILETAVVFGVPTGVLEVLNIAIENGLPFLERGPAVPIGFMAFVFTLWGIAGFRTARSIGSVGAGVLASVSSACICMLIAIAAGFAVEFFLATPDATAIATWNEYKRSGWTDPRAFGIANTLDFSIHSSHRGHGGSDGCWWPWGVACAA